MKKINCWECKDNKPYFQIRLIFKIKRLFIVKIIVNPKENETTFVLFNHGFTNNNNKSK